MSNPPSPGIWPIPRGSLVSTQILRLVVDSGGKSLYAWFDGEHLTPEVFRQLFTQARRFGACRSTLTKCHSRHPLQISDLGFSELRWWHIQLLTDAVHQQTVNLAVSRDCRLSVFRWIYPDRMF